MRLFIILYAPKTQLLKQKVKYLRKACSQEGGDVGDHPRLRFHLLNITYPISQILAFLHIFCLFESFF